MMRASGICLRSVRSAGVAIATSPTQFGNTTPPRTAVPPLGTPRTAFPTEFYEGSDDTPPERIAKWQSPHASRCSASNSRRLHALASFYEVGVDRDAEAGAVRAADDAVFGL